jgi:hypothetical protein
MKEEFGIAEPLENSSTNQAANLIGKQPKKKEFWTTWWFWVAVVIILILLTSK